MKKGNKKKELQIPSWQKESEVTLLRKKKECFRDFLTRRPPHQRRAAAIFITRDGLHIISPSCTRSCMPGPL